MVSTTTLPKKRMAIVSSYNESCGNASYTHALMREFSNHLDVEVLALDLFVLQRRGPWLRKHGDNHIRRLAACLKDYDYVNIQFEAGLFGSSSGDIMRRLRWLINAAPNLILTMHRVDLIERSRKEIILNSVIRRSPGYYIREVRRSKFPKLYRDIVETCERASRSKNVWVCVHTKRERRIITEFMSFAKCFDFPLAFLNAEDRASALTGSSRSQFFDRHKFPADQKVVGAFGYLSNYKGLETLIEALNLLPDEYILALFGTQHPQTIKMNTPLDPYLASLIAQIEDTPGLSDRIRFMGNLPDQEFIEALRWCDAVVLPYVEVGQSMSGVVVLGLECGARMFCSNNYSFAETSRYFGDTFFKFDIGNYLELAQRIQYADADFSTERDASFKRYNINESVKLHLEKFGFDAMKGMQS